MHLPTSDPNISCFPAGNRLVDLVNVFLQNRLPYAFLLVSLIGVIEGLSERPAYPIPNMLYSGEICCVEYDDQVSILSLSWTSPDMSLLSIGVQFETRLFAEIYFNPFRASAVQMHLAVCSGERHSVQ
ncbi:hypothetical protein TNCV_4499131 [Trichonephila clavipes]|nr:hypothetical protein TNCV_4499131 [Trichonephila clavipes]